ncbi:MAG: metal-dependent hydrolase [Bacteroidota bacterium]
MDSLSQIVLGAAVGEVTLGKKVGNRAMLWGAVGGTIPDLDVIFSPLLTPLQDLVVHRGFSHSIVFSILGAFLFGWLIKRLYASRWHTHLATAGWLLIPIGVTFFVSRIFESGLGVMGTIIMAAFLIVFGFLIWRHYQRRSWTEPNATMRDWQRLMFWSIFTHPILDCFTTYGTQLFLPFSSYRVAFNAIAVADPIYTAPFLILVVIASFFHRERSLRRTLTWVGLAVSSGYLLFAVVNKQRVNAVWTASLAANKAEYVRWMTSPTIFNNVLWNCLAETEDAILYGQYSLFDHERKVHFQVLPKNRHLVKEYHDGKTLKVLDWFSDGYLVFSQDKSVLQANDLRFGIGTLADGSDHFIFHFPLEAQEGRLTMTGLNGGPPPGREQEMISAMFDRMWGK